MNRKVGFGISLVIVALAGGYFLFKNAHARPSVTTTLRVSVAPGGQLEFVAGQAKSAVFRYMISKESGVPPALTRGLEVKTLPNSALLEARVSVMTQDEAERFAKGFVPALQSLCGKQVQLTLADQNVK